jgi:hypothetical protein
MTNGEIDFTDWSQTIGMDLLPITEPDLLALSDQEVSYYVRAEDAGYWVQQTDRGGPRRTLGRFAEVADARRFLIMITGQALRSTRGRETAMHDHPAPGTLLAESAGGVQLKWSGGSATFPAGLTANRRAVQFSWLVGQPESAIAARYAR